MTKRNKSPVKTEVDYIKEAKDAWEQARQILEHADSWITEDGRDIEKGCVCTRKFESLGKVWRLEAMLDATPEEVFDVLVTRVNDWPQWNPTIEECKTLQAINENTDISYNVGAAQVGGLVSSRDFVNLRHWETSSDDVMIAAACHTTHKDMPPCKKHVRGENKPASYVFQRVPGQPDKCHFYCFLRTDLKGWLPQILIDQAMTGVLRDYLKHLQIYLTDIRKAKSVDSSVSMLQALKLSSDETSEKEENSSVDSDSEYQDASDSEDFADASDDVFSVPMGPLMIEPVCS